MNSTNHWELYPINQFEKFIQSWDTLNNKIAKSPILESRFIGPCLRHFPAGDALLALCGDQDNPTAMTIVNKNRFGVWETYQPSQAPIGAWMCDSTADLNTLLNSLANVLPGIVLSIGITQQDTSFLARPKNQTNIRTLDYINTARVNINETFDEYWANRGKNLRQNLRRQRNRLEREDVTTTLKTFDKPDQMKDCIAEYGKLESAGWKSQGGTAISPENDQGLFYTEMLQRFAETGDGFVFNYLYNDKIVAVDLCIKGNGTLIILKTTYDESQKTSSPALLMRQDSFQHFFNMDGLEKIEFYGKVMDWHTKWASDIRTMYHINYYPWKLLALLKS